MPSVLTVPEVATTLQVSTKKVYQMIQAGEIEHFRVGKQIRILPKHLKRLILPKPCNRYPRLGV